MKLIAVVAFAVLIFAVLWAAEAPKGKEVTIKGEVVDLWCFMKVGARGADHEKCAIDCAKAGNPIGIVDEKEEIYVAMGGKDKQPAKDILLEKMAKTVTVKGTLYKRGGIQAIYIESVE